MAWIFELAAELGPNREAADAFADHFAAFVASDSSGESHHCSHSLWQAYGAWWCRVDPDDVSKSGVCSVEDARQMTEIGWQLYNRLRTAPPYRYALVGVESEMFRTFEEIDDDLVTLHFEGVVLSEPIWRQIGSPGIFVPFEPGYVWRPYEGEKYDQS